MIALTVPQEAEHAFGFWKDNNCWLCSSLSEYPNVLTETFNWFQAHAT